jgi:hypothetical protein
MCDYTDPTYQVHSGGTSAAIYTISNTGHVDTCNACLLNNNCAGGGNDDCYKPCFGFEKIVDDDLEDIAGRFTNGQGKTYTLNADVEIDNDEKFEDKFGYIMFLDDSSLKFDNIEKVEITATQKTGAPTKTTITIPIFRFTLNTDSTIDADNKLNIILYRFRKKEATDSGFDTLQKTYAPVLQRLNNIYTTHQEAITDNYDVTENLYNYKDNPADQIANTIFSKVKGIYMSNTTNVRAKHVEKESKQKEIDAIKLLYDDKKKIIDNLKALNHTSKRQIEINMYKSKKMEDTNKALMIVMIIVGCLIIFPILAKTKVASIGLFVGLWIAALLIVLIYMFYVLYYKQIGQDELEYAKYNFNKPSDKEVALSMAKATMSDKEKTRCQAFAELEDEFDFSDIGEKIDVSKYTSQVDNTNKCGL